MSGSRVSRSRVVSRRDALRFLGLGAVGAAGAALLGCGGGEGTSSAGASTPPGTFDLVAEGAPSVLPTPEPTPVGPLPPLPAGREVSALLEGTSWETPLYAMHSGHEGPRALVLGGVHGNEPGGWLAAESLAEWEPSAGSLVVVPRANRLATFALERTLPDLGDLNRAYPGALDAEMPMSRMAAAILEIARWYEVDLVIDMHESWGFYNERGENTGTAFIGQTVGKGEGPLTNDVLREVIAEVNAQVSEREALVFRERIGPPQTAPGATATVVPVAPTPTAGTTGGRSTSSLSLGQYVPGLTPVLVEMGQMDQLEGRRRDLHLLFARALLTRHGVL